MEFHLGRYFDFNAHTAIFIGWEFGSVSNREASRCFDFNFELLAVNLGHSLDFLELNCIAIIKAVSFVFVQIDCRFLLLSDSSDVNKFWLFSSQVEDSMGFSEVNESVSVKAEVTGQNKADFILSASLVKSDQVFSIVVVEDDDAFEMFGAEIRFKNTCIKCFRRWRC